MKNQIRSIKNRFKPKTMLSQSQDQSSLSEQNEALNVIYKRIEVFQFSEAQRLLTEFRNTYDNSSKFQYLNYHLVSIVQSEDAKIKQALLARELLSNPEFLQVKASVVARIWNENPKLQNQLTDNLLRLVAYKLCESDNLDYSEQIIQFLLENHPSKANIKLVQRIAKSFAEQNNQPKRIYFLKLANELNAQQLSLQGG